MRSCTGKKNVHSQAFIQICVVLKVIKQGMCIGDDLFCHILPPDLQHKAACSCCDIAVDVTNDMHRQLALA